MIYLIVGVLIGISVGFHVGWYGKKLLEMTHELINRDPPTIEGVFTPLPPGEADVNNLSAVVTPKTPAQIEWEERQKMNSL